MKPILFNTEMVRAILEGRKTVTRRVIDRDIVNNCDMETDGTLLNYQDANGDFIDPVKLCRCKVNDILYVRETWYKGLNRILYKANYSDNEKFYKNGKQIALKWRPSIHMPKAAARIFLRVKSVRVERLQDITNEQILSEGINKGQIESYIEQFPEDTAEWIRAAYTLAWSELWNKTIKKDQWHYYYWNVNPYVWVIEFERISKEAAVQEA